MKKILLIKSLFIGLFITFNLNSNAQTAQVLHFDGVNDYTSLATNPVQSATDFTFEAWLNINPNHNWERVMDFGNYPGYNMFLTSSSFGSDYPRFAINIGYGEQVVDGTTPLPVGTWCHLSVTINSATTTATMYLDGNIIGQNTSFTFTPASMGATTNNWLGRSQYAADYYYRGGMDEVRFWNSVRTQAQVQFDMANNTLMPEPNLVAYYKFNQGIAGGYNPSVTIATDATGNSNTFTLNNFGLNGATSNWITPGPPIAPCVGDGVAPVISCPGNIFLTGCTNTTTFSVTATDALPNCGDAIITQTTGLPSGSIFPLGNTINTFVATDFAGNTSSCSFTVNVAGEAIPPVITCPGNITETCTPIITFQAVATDNCGASGSQTFNYTGAIETFIVPGNVTSLTIDVYGAQGGSGGGTGAHIVGDISVTPGQTLKILVGQQGSSAGGGGGSFVTDASNNPLVIAGGGGAGTNNLHTQGQITTMAADGTATGSYSGTYSGKGGNNGGGGGAGSASDNSTSGGNGGIGCVDGSNTNGGSPNCGAGGGGLCGNGGNSSGYQATGGFSFVAGGVGGTSGGGFGGGGGGYSGYGGGGGYSGGGGGAWTSDWSTAFGGGGGSFNSGTNQSNTAGVQSGNGLITITWNQGPTITYVPASGSTFSPGTTLVTATATDFSGNSASCTFNVTYTPSLTPPTFTFCPTPIVENCNPLITYAAPTATSTCPGAVTITQIDGTGLTSGSTFPIGTTTQIYRATDINGNSSTCSFTVTYTPETIPPNITCPANIIENCGMANITYTMPTATDNCPGAISITQSTGIASGGVFPMGVTTNTFIATDIHGNTSSCSFTVTRALDTQAPILSCSSDINEGCNPVISWPTPTATDNCAGLVTQSFNFTGGMQTFIVPAGVTSVNIDAYGAQGANSFQAAGGLGGRAQGSLAVVPGQVLNIFVGGQNGFNGGGVGNYGGYGSYNGVNGGGASDIRIGGVALTDRVIVAGAGGGAGNSGYYWSAYPGGAGGGLIGGNGAGCCGGTNTGGTQALGGNTSSGCGYPGTNGSLGQGGNGGTEGYDFGGGSGGGGGYYGGGGGESCGSGWAGAGGSSYTGSLGGATTVSGVRSGDGAIIITYSNLIIAQTGGPVSGSTFTSGVPQTITYTATDASNNVSTCSFVVTYTADNVDPNFTNCPTNITLNCNSVATWVDPSATDNCSATNGNQTFNYTGAVQTFTVPSGVTSLTINAIGAAGGTYQYYNYAGGKGASMSGDFAVTPGETLYLLVGGKGQNTNNYYQGAGGGGGTFISRDPALATNLLLVAGGGGGAAQYYNSSIVDATTGATGNNGYVVYWGGGAGGNSGNGGNGAGGAYGGGGGAGWLSNGANGAGCSQNYGIKPSNGGAGGINCYGGNGGFGGGGAAYYGAGGGGGYSGGGGGDSYYYWGYPSCGGGGGSFNGGTNQNNLAGVGLGDGSVNISYTGDLVITRTDVSGYNSGDTFPANTPITIEYTATDGANNTTTCSFTVTYTPDPNPPTLVGCPTDIVQSCDPVISWTAPTATDLCMPNGTTTFNYTGGVQTFVVPAGVTSLTINSVGAAGGSNNYWGAYGGKGASLTGDFAVTPGESLYLMVGGQGTSTNGYYLGGGGGGGSFISRSSNFSANLLMAAGGGGGGGVRAYANSDASVSNNGNAGNNGGYYGSAAGGTSGAGGSGFYYGAGGAGWLSNGNSYDTYCMGTAYRPNASGAGGINNCSSGGNGGYGGGGSGSNGGGGGGGGYSGGGGGDQDYAYYTYSGTTGGGGGSYNGGTNANNIAGVGTGNGFITISYLVPPTVVQTSGPVSGSTFADGVTETIVYTATDMDGHTSTCSFTVTYNADPNPPTLVGCPTDIVQSCDPVISWTAPTATDLCITSGTTTFNYTGGVQTFVVPAGVTSLTINSVGAAGGSNNYYGAYGGKGASLTGDFAVTPGESLYLMVGGQGTSTNGYYLGGGGGGGSFISRSSDFSANLLMAAGGGGGGGVRAYANSDASVSNNGNAGNNGGYYGGAAGGTSGAGGSGFYYGAGGAGWLSNGNSYDTYCMGTAYRPNASGAGGINNCGSGGNGGYGGGGSGSNGGGGGGGGYSGGGGGDYDYYPFYTYSGTTGGGGGSYNGGTNANNIAGVGTGNGFITISYLVPPTVVQTSGPVSGSTFADGVTETIVYTATDMDGHTSTCSFTVTYNADQIDPVITCPSDITVNNTPGSCDAVVTFADATATDNCGISGSQTFNYTGSLQTFTVPSGVTSIIVNAVGAQGGGDNGTTGGLGASMQGTFTVTPGEVLDILVGGKGSDGNASLEYAGGGGGSFVVRAGNIPLIVGGGGGGTNGGPTSGSENAPITTSGLDGYSQTYGAVGNGYNGYGGTGGNGGNNGAQICAGNGGGFYTNGQEPGCGGGGPTSGFAYLNGGAGGLSVCSPGVNGGYGGGGGGGCQGAGGGGGYSGGGGNYHYGGNGGGGGSYNIGTSQTNIAGVQTGNGVVIITYDQGPTVAQTGGPVSGSTFPVGSTPITYTATDAAGNSSTCTFNVIVNDTEAPILSCQTIQVSPAGGSPVVVAGPELVASVTDCSTISYAVIPNSFDCSQVGQTISVVLTATDSYGNSTTCSTTVEVMGGNCNQPPIAVCQTVSVNADGSCQGTATASQFNNGSTDPEMGALSFSVSPAGPYALGNTTVTLTVTDVGGLTATCTTTITVTDITAPAITCPATQTLNLDGSCAGVLANYTSMATTSDNCGAVTVTQSPAIGSAVSGVGTTVVTLTATDAAGNTSTCNFNVNRVDVTGPNITCGAPITVSAFCGTANITVQAPTTSDGCGGAIITVSSHPSSFYTLGTTVVTWTATDSHGNTSTCTQNVTVTAPEVDVTGNAISIADGSTSYSTLNYTDFGNVPVCLSTVTKTYYIKNLGTSNLNLTGTPRIVLSGANAADFVVSTQPALSLLGPGQQTSFSIRFDPSATGFRYATITIQNTDCNEAVYDFGIRGSGRLCAEPESNDTNDSLPVTQIDHGTTNTADGSSTTNTTSIEDEDVFDGKIYPNPSNGIFTLELSKMPRGHAEIKVMDALGQVIYSNEIMNQSMYYDFSYLRAATYYISVISNEGIFTKKITITHAY